MTFRAKPVVKRAHRPAWEGQDRRNFYMNIGFGLIVIIAVVILLVAAGLSYYDDHLAPVGSVDGQSITKDEYADRLAIETWRLDETERRIRTASLAGRLTQTQAQTQEQIVTQQRSTLQSTTLERLIDQKLQATLAVQEDVSASPADIDARLTTEATTPEARHAWVIAVKPDSDLGSTGPTAAQTEAARVKLQSALDDIAGGKSWEDVAKTVSTDTSTAAQGGDLGWIMADDVLTDEDFLKALFAVDVNKPTAIVEGADHILRAGRVTEITPASVDPNYVSSIQNDKIDIGKYRAVVAGDVIRQKLEDKIVAGLTGPAPQRHVQEIYIADNSQLLGSEAIKVRHILYSPNDDPANASSVAADDPAWQLAEQQATATYQKLQLQPELFDSIARTESDESQARGATGTGGKLPYFDKDSQVDPAFLAAIFSPDAKPGALLPPVKSAFGWHVIQVMYGPPDIDHLKALKTQADGGADFAALARDNSEAPSAGNGGDIGWVAKGQLDDKLTEAIFAAPIGGTSETVIVPTDGVYLFKVIAEETRTPEGRQLDTIKKTAFSNWYQAHKSVANITRDSTISGSTTSS
jgi:parvulin-like peptidyl-prolyl isomerase